MGGAASDKQMNAWHDITTKKNTRTHATLFFYFFYSARSQSQFGVMPPFFVDFQMVEEDVAGSLEVPRTTLMPQFTTHPPEREPRVPGVFCGVERVKGESRPGHAEARWQVVCRGLCRLREPPHHHGQGSRRLCHFPESENRKAESEKGRRSLF